MVEPGLESSWLAPEPKLFCGSVSWTPQWAGFAWGMGGLREAGGLWEGLPSQVSSRCKDEGLRNIVAPAGGL